MLCFSAFSLSACSTFGAVTGAASAGGKAAAQEGGLQRAWNDAKIQAQINDLWFRESMDIFTKLDLTVNQGRVLITGVVQNPESRVEAVRLAWKASGVKQVINEIRVAESQGFSGFARDTWATTRLRTAITLDRKVQSINYNIDTVQGIVYLMGVAQSQAELNHVIEVARTIPDVKEVVSYVMIKGEDVQSLKSDSSLENPVSVHSDFVKQPEARVNVVPLPPEDLSSDMSQSFEAYQAENSGTAVDADAPIMLQRQSIEARPLEPVEWN